MVMDVPHLDDWKILHQLSVHLLNSEDTTRKLERVLEAINHFHGTTKALISLLDSSRARLFVRASTGLSATVVEDLSQIELGQGCCGMAFAQGRRVVVADFDTDSLFEKFRDWTQQHGIGAGYSTPMFTTAGDVLGVLTVYFDAPHIPAQHEVELTEICAGTVAAILERDSIEDQLRRERDRRDQVLRGMAEGLCVVDHDFRVLEMNATAVHINRRPVEDMIGKSHWELWPDTVDSPVGREYRRAMRERVPVQLENMWTDPEGRTGWFELSAQPIDEGLALYFRDITQRKLAQQEIEESAQRYRMLSETVSDLVWRADASGKPIGDTTSWRRYTDDWSDELRWINSVHPEDCARVQDTWKRYLAEGMPAIDSYRVRRKDGQYRHFESRAVPLRDQNGHVFEWIGTCTDTTDKIMQAEEMRLANERKDRFLAVLSHELRNPLAATSMAARLIESQATTSARAVQLGEVIQRQVGHMSRLVEDLVDMSRVTMGLVLLNKQMVDIGRIAHEAVEQIRPMMVAKRHTLTLDLPLIPCQTFGDKTRLVQVLSNLLSNAARYTPGDGNISLRVVPEHDKILVEVTDNGIGIPSDAIGSIFDFYTQAERSTDRKGGGLGLGLALVKSLVEAHGGTVRVSSDGDGMGSIFSLTLPRSLS